MNLFAMLIQLLRQRKNLIASLCAIAFAGHPLAVGAANHAQQAVQAGKKKRPQLYSAQLEIGPFDLHRKYRSMEGPYVMQRLRIGDLLASKKVQLPESMVVYIEGRNSAPAMQVEQPSNSAREAIGLINTANNDRELLWFKGIKIQVLDEHDKPLPTAEFICHTNVDVDLVTRYMAFPDLEKARTSDHRIMTLTQGQTEFHFPKGFAVPVASDEEWKFTFQAANRTTSERRRIKHLCTLYFEKDADLEKSPKALYWYNPYMAVKLQAGERESHHNGPGCIAMSSGDNAPSMVPDTNFKGSSGQILSPHWSVPPGKHVYTFPLSKEMDSSLAAEDRTIHAVWSHVHPACTKTSLSVCDGKKKQRIFNVQVSTSFKHGPELLHIDNIITEKGLRLKANKNLELSATYNNPENAALDSMVAFGVFCKSKTFSQPDWSKQTISLENMNSVHAEKNAKTSPGSKGNAAEKDCDLYCGIKPENPNPQTNKSD